MMVINAKFFIKEDMRAEFLAEAQALIEATRKEAGCLAYDLFESLETANAFVMIENWENQAAIDGHNQSPLLQKMFANVPKYSSAAPILTIAEAKGAN